MKVLYVAVGIACVQVVVLVILDKHVKTNPPATSKLPHTQPSPHKDQSSRDTEDVNHLVAPMEQVRVLKPNVEDYDVLHWHRSSHFLNDSAKKNPYVNEDAIHSYKPVNSKPVLERQSDKQIHLNNTHPKLAVGSAYHTHIAIPKIIHQIWNSAEVPMPFVSWIQGWIKNHPDWEYWFWTPEDMRLFLDNVAPDFVTSFTAYEQDIYRANAMRYYIMYYFGGLYIDLDMENLRPLDDWINNTCVLPLETEAHAYIIHKRENLNVMINLLLCRPGHPFFKFAIENLLAYQDLSAEHKLLYADMLYEEYSKNVHENTDQIVLAEPKYFMPTFDISKVMLIRQICGEEGLTDLQDTICEDLDMSEYQSRPSIVSYADHHWSHVVENEEYFQYGQKVAIKDVVPNVKNVSNIITSFIGVQEKKLAKQYTDKKQSVRHSITSNPKDVPNNRNHD